MTDSVGRRPRCFVRLNGETTVPLAFAVESNTHFQADTFSVSLEAWQQPDGFGLEYWADSANVMAEILVGFLNPSQDEAAMPSNLTTLILGQVDDLDCDPTTGALTITGRDLTGKLIDQKITQTFPDQTASQIVTKLATDAGLTPVVTATTTPVGEYSKGAYASLGREVPVWDLIVSYAQREGFDAYVSGSKLYFGPIEADQDTEPYTISCQRGDGAISISTQRLQLRRSLTLAKDIIVTVISHSVAKGVPIKAVAKRQGASKGATTSFKLGATSQSYVLRRPNLSQAQATQLAQKTLADLSRFERTFEATDWDDGTLTPRRRARITGTGTSFDQDYYIDKISRHFSFGEYAMTVSGKNHPVESEPVV